MDHILDRPCQIDGTPHKPANHTNRDCWVFKQAGKLNAENKEKGSQREDDDEELGVGAEGGDGGGENEELNEIFDKCCIYSKSIGPGS